jgi:hypothetical protein
LGHRVLRDLLGREEEEECRDQRVKLEDLDQLENQERKALWVLLVRSVQKEIKGKRVERAIKVTLV